MFCVSFSIESFVDKVCLNNNRDLEKAVEDLSELLESPIEADNIPTLRQQVTNKTVCFPPMSYSPGILS